MELLTERLRLLALTRRQLELYRTAPQELEQQLGFPVSRAILTEPVHRALAIKVARMADALVEQHPWLTYWLVAVQAQPFGAGLAGFKGVPDAQGHVEIGYGIDPAYEGQGYTTEAVRALIAWAFQAPECRAVWADPRKDNLASNRLLARVGMSIVGMTEDTFLWQIDAST